MNKVKVIVKKAFRDKISGVYHKVNDKMTISEDRFREIKRTGDFVEIEKESTAVKGERPSTEIKK